MLAPQKNSIEDELMDMEKFNEEAQGEDLALGDSGLEQVHKTGLMEDGSHKKGLVEEGSNS